MSVIRLRAGQACPVCGSTTGLPHASLRDCESAARESRSALEQARVKRDEASSDQLNARVLSRRKRRA